MPLRRSWWKEYGSPHQLSLPFHEAHAADSFPNLGALGDARHMSYSLNSLKGGYIGDYIRDYYRVIKGDTRSLDNGSYDS